MKSFFCTWLWVPSQVSVKSEHKQSEKLSLHSCFIAKIYECLHIHLYWHKKIGRFTDALQFPVVTSCHCVSKDIIRNFCLFVCLLVFVVEYELCSTYICPQPHGKAQATVRSNFKCQVASEQILAEPEPHKDGYLALKQLHKSMFMTLISYSLFVFFRLSIQFGQLSKNLHRMLLT